MTVRLMRPGDSAETAGGWVTVTARLSEVVRGGAELVVRAADGSAPEETGPIRDGHGTVMLTGIGSAVDVLVRTPDGMSFPHGTAAGLRIMVEFPDSGDRDEFAFEDVNIAGLVIAALASLAPTADRLEVAAPAPARSTATAAEPAAVVLDGLAGEAQTLAREVVGHRARLPESERRQFRVLLDRSASMLPHARSGAVADVLAVLQGLNAVAGTAAVEVLAVPGDTGWIPVEGTDLVASVYATVETGFGLGDRLSGLDGDAVYVVTDMSPPDLGQARCHVLVVGAGPRLREDRAGLARLVRAALSWTEVGDA